MRHHYHGALGAAHGIHAGRHQLERVNVESDPSRPDRQPRLNTAI